VLNRGYAIVTRTADGSLVRQAGQVSKDESIHIRVSQGSLDARVSKINQEQPNE
jgi:exodeoxyribonuclease VII large subunit